PAIAAAPGFTTTAFVAWGTPGPNIRGRGFDLPGSSQKPLSGEVQVNVVGGNHAGEISVAALHGGRFVSTYPATSFAAGEIRVHRLDPNFNNYFNFQVQPSGLADSQSHVAALADGGFAVTWTRDIGGDKDLYAATYNSDGLLRATHVVNDNTNNAS